MSKQNEKKIFVGLINNTTRDAMTPHTTKSLNLFALKLKVSNKFYDNFVTKSINSAININIIIGERKLFTLITLNIYIYVYLIRRLIRALKDFLSDTLSDRSNLSPDVGKIGRDHKIHIIRNATCARERSVRRDLQHLWGMWPATSWPRDTTCDLRGNVGLG